MQVTTADVLETIVNQKNLYVKNNKHQNVDLVDEIKAKIVSVATLEHQFVEYISQGYWKFIVITKFNIFN